MKKQSFIAFFLVLLAFSPEKSLLLGHDNAHDFKLNKTYFDSFLKDFLEVGSSPKGWKERDVVRLSAVLVSGSLLFALDGKIQDWVQERRSSTSEDISRMFSPLGHGLFLGSSLILLYASGEILEDSKLRKIALLGLESWVISGVIVTGLKCFTGRARPNLDESHTSFHPLSSLSRYHSFPSGHASSAFGVATTIADQSESLVVDIVAYSLATLATISRIHDDKHWASDVFIGAAIGHFVSKKISDLNQKESKEKLNASIWFTSQGQAFSVTLYF